MSYREDNKGIAPRIADIERRLRAVETPSNPEYVLRNIGGNLYYVYAPTGAIGPLVGTSGSTSSGSTLIVSGGGGGGSVTAGMSNLGNTDGTSGVVSGSDVALFFAGGANVTLSQSINGSSATISVVAGGGGAGNFTAGVSTIGNTSGNTGTVTNRLILAGGNNITLSQSTNGGGATVTISAPNQTVQTQNLHNVTLSGNTAGAMAQISSGTMTLAGGNNITLSQAGNAVTISAANTVAQTNQSIGIYGSGNTSGTSTGTLDARSFTVRAQGSLTVDMTNGLINLSAPNALTTAMASNRGSDFVAATAAFNGTNASGTIASNAISVSVAAPVAQTNQTLGIYASSQTTGQSSSSTYDARSLTFRGAGLVSVGHSAGEILISVSAAQTNQTLGIYGSGNTAGTSTGTLDARSLSVNVSGSLTVDMTNGMINLSAPNALTTAMASNRGSDFVAAAAVFNGTNASGTIASNAISVSVAAAAAQTNQTVGIYGQGNTSGTSTGTLDARSLSVSAMGSLTVDMTNGVINLSAPNALTTAMASNRGSDFVAATAVFNGRKSVV